MKRALVLLPAVLAVAGLAGCGPVAAFQEPRQPVFGAAEIFPDELLPLIKKTAAGEVTYRLHLDRTHEAGDCSEYWLPGYEPRGCQVALFGHYSGDYGRIAAMVIVYVLDDAEYASDFYGRSLSWNGRSDGVEFDGGIVGRYGVDVRVFDGTNGSELDQETPDLTGEVSELAGPVASGTCLLIEDLLKQRVGL